jgi:hypothetical protein
MIEFKRRTLFLSNGKQIKLFGNSLAIARSLEVGEGYAPNIFSILEQQQEEKAVPEISKDAQDGKKKRGPAAKTLTASVSNPHKLTQEDLMEIADYNIQLWMDLKANIRKHGLNSPKIFNQEAAL